MAVAGWLAWGLNGSIAAPDWLPYALLAGLALALVLWTGAAGMPPRLQLVALGGLLGLAAWDAISAAWSAAPSLARDEGLLVTMYAAALALPLVTLRGRGDRSAVLIAVAAAGSALTVATGAKLLLAPEAGITFEGGRLAYPIMYVNAQAALALIGLWPALVVASRRELPAVVRALAAGGAGAMLATWIAVQSKGAGFALAVSAAALFAFAPGRLRLLVPAALAAVPAALAAATLTAPYELPPVRRGPAVEDVGAAILLVAAAAALAGLVYALADRRVRVGPRVHRTAGAVVLAGLVAAVAAGSAVAWSRVDDPREWAEARWETLTATDLSDVTGTTHFSALGGNRYDIWRVSLEEFRDHPLAGVGARGFAASYLVLGRSQETPARGHSLPLDALAETGVVGGALLLLGVGLPVALLARRLRDPAAVAAFGAAVYFVVHASGDWLWTIPPLGLFFFTLVGLGLAAPGRPLEGRLAAAAGTAVALAAVALYAPPWLSARLSDAALQRDDPPTSARLEWARRLDPLSTTPDLVAAELSDSPAAAASQLRRAVEREPRSAGLRYVLALAYLDAGRTDAARRELLAARRLFPRDPAIDAALRRARGR